MPVVVVLLLVGALVAASRSGSSKRAPSSTPAAAPAPTCISWMTPKLIPTEAVQAAVKLLGSPPGVVEQTINGMPYQFTVATTNGKKNVTVKQCNGTAPAPASVS